MHPAAICDAQPAMLHERNAPEETVLSGILSELYVYNGTMSD